MMSNVLEKTIGSIFSTSDSYSGLQGLFKQCIAVRTKKEEADMIQHYLSLLRERLKEPGIRPNFVGHCLAFAIFAELLGYPAEFAYIHAINLAQQSSLPDKKMGYAASCCLLGEHHELRLLLVNTLVRDLASSNVAVLGLALSALCSAPLPAEAIPALLPAVRDRLGHATAYVRCRAVIAMHHLLRRHPEQCCHVVSSVVARLGDEDPHVVARVLATLPDIIQVSPESVSSLVAPLVSIQRQILGGKLPEDMTYLGLHAPWTQLNIIRCLTELSLTEEDESAAREVLVETLTQSSVKDGSFVPLLRAALVSQSVSALLSLEPPSEAGQARAMLHVGALLRCSSPDVKHEGLQLLESVLARHQIPLTPEQQTVVRASLDHPDSSIQRRALALLTAGAGAPDVQPVCGQLFKHAENAEPHLRQWLLEQALDLIGRFPAAVTPDWQLSALVKLLPLADQPQLSQRIFKATQDILLNGDLKSETRTKLLGVLSQHGEAKQAPTCLLILYIWTLGHFPQLDPGGCQGALTKLVTLGHKILRHCKSSSRELLSSIIESCAKAVERPGFEPSQELSEFLTQVSCVCPELHEDSSELLHTLPHLARLRKCLTVPAPSLDCSLSCVDSLVAESLSGGTCRPYLPTLAAQIWQQRVRTPEVGLPSLLVVPVPSVMQTSQESNQTTSQPSEDSWSVRSISSPTEATSPVAPSRSLWTKQGRAASPEPATSAATPLAEAFTGTTQQIPSQPSSVTYEDPLGELLR